MGIDQKLAALGLAIIIVPLVQILIGTIPSVFKRWFIEKKEYSKRVNFLCEKLTEDMSIALYQIFDRSKNSEVSLRGQLPESSDLLNPYHKMMQSHSVIILKVGISYEVYRICNSILFYIALVGLIISMFVIFKLYLSILVALSLFLILLELILILIMYKKTSVLEDFEHTYLKSELK